MADCRVRASGRRTYRLIPHRDGCRLTERFETEGWIPVWYHLWSRYPMLRRGMRKTQQAIKTDAEQAAAPQRT